MKNNISKRLKFIAQFIDEGSFFADIGSDHAYLPTFVCLKDSKARAIAGEVNEGPYNKAKSVVEAYNLTHKIDVKRGDGLEVIQNTQVDTVIIAGMGGKLIKSILTKHALPSSVNKLILQPNLDAHILRDLIQKEQLSLENEFLIEENEHFYTVLIISMTPSEKSYTEKELLFGPALLSEKSDVFIRKWKEELNKIDYIINQISEAEEVNHTQLNKFKGLKHLIEEVIK